MGFHAMKYVEDNNISRATLQLSAPSDVEFYYLMKVVNGVFLMALIILLLLRFFIVKKYSRRISRRNAVLRAVYENPDIKALVQEQLDEDIGDDLHPLSRPGGKCFVVKVCDRFCF